MVVAMVRFSAALVEGRSSSSTWRWGLAYGTSWAAILGIVPRLVEGADDGDTPALLTLIVAAWGAFHAFWIWLALGMAAPARSGTRQFAGRLAMVGLGVTAVAGAQLAHLSALTIARPRALPLLIFVALAGVALMIAGGVRKAIHDNRTAVFARDGEEGEVDEEYARRNAEAQPSLRGPLEPATIVMGLGAALMIAGAFGAGIAAGPPPVKLLCGGALAFVLFQVARGLRRR